MEIALTVGYLVVAAMIVGSLPRFFLHRLPSKTEDGSAKAAPYPTTRDARFWASGVIPVSLSIVAGLIAALVVDTSDTSTYSLLLPPAVMASVACLCVSFAYFSSSRLLLQQCVVFSLFSMLLTAGSVIEGGSA